MEATKNHYDRFKDKVKLWKDIGYVMGAVGRLRMELRNFRS